MISDTDARRLFDAYEAGEKFVDDLKLGCAFMGAGPAADDAGFKGRDRGAFIAGALDRIENRGVKIWTVVAGAEITRIERRA